MSTRLILLVLLLCAATEASAQVFVFGRISLDRYPDGLVPDSDAQSPLLLELEVRGLLDGEKLVVRRVESPAFPDGPPLSLLGSGSCPPEIAFSRELDRLFCTTETKVLTAATGLHEIFTGFIETDPPASNVLFPWAYQVYDTPVRTTRFDVIAQRAPVATRDDLTWTVDIGFSNFVRLTSLVSTRHGDLFAEGICTPPSGPLPIGQFSCEFTEQLEGQPGAAVDFELVATFVDDAANVVTASSAAHTTFVDASALAYLDVMARPSAVELDDPTTVAVEIGMPPASRIVVPVIEALSDGEGSLEHGAPSRPGSLCELGDASDATGTYHCVFSLTPAGETAPDAIHYEVSARVSDFFRPEIKASLVASTQIELVTDQPPLAAASLRASPDVLPVPGGDLVWRVAVQNGGKEPITLIELDGLGLGSLNGRGTCRTGVAIQPGVTFECAISDQLNDAEAGDERLVSVLGVVSDDEGNQQEVHASGVAQVGPLNTSVAAAVGILANPAVLPAEGGMVEFDLVLMNLGVSGGPTGVDLVVDELHLLGESLHEVGTCKVGEAIPHSFRNTYTCAIQREVTAAPGTTLVFNADASFRNQLSGEVALRKGFASVTMAAAPTPALSVSLQPAAISENGGVSNLTVTRSGTTNGALILNLGATGLGATSLSLPDTTITIPDGSSAATVPVTALNDDFDNGTRVATLTVSIGNIPAASAELQITDDDDPTPTLSLLLEPSTISENEGVSNLTVTRSGTPTGALVVNLGVKGLGADSLSLPGPTITIADGSSAKTVQVTALDDDVENGTRGATLTVSAAGIPAGASAQLQITDDEEDEVSLFSDGFE